MLSQPIPLAEVIAAQRTGFTYAFDRGGKQRELVRKQRNYAARRAHLETVLSLFEAGPPPELVLRDSTTELVLGLGDTVHEVEPILHDLLDKVLGQMESDIVALHLAIEREERENLARPPAEVDYTSGVAVVWDGR